MELSKVSMVTDDDSADSLDDGYTEPVDAEKATLDRWGGAEPLAVEVLHNDATESHEAVLCLSVSSWTTTRTQKARSSCPMG